MRLDEEYILENTIGGKVWRNKYYLNASIGSNGNDGLVFERPLKTLAVAEDKLESLKKDCIILEESASSLSLASAFTWDKSLCGLVGTSENEAYQRSRISQSAAIATLLTVSGYGNLFANIRVMYGTASATNKTAISLTGSGNTFKNFNIAGTNATAMAEADFRLVKIAADENYFQGCQIGNINAAQAAGTLVYFDGSCTPNMTFRDCTFLMNASANAAFFLQFAAGVGESAVKFYNCQFINTGTALTYAIDGTGLNNCIVYLDNSCSFYGATDIVAAANESCVIFGSSTASASTDDLYGIAKPYDHTP